MTIRDTLRVPVRVTVPIRQGQIRLTCHSHGSIPLRVWLAMNGRHPKQHDHNPDHNSSDGFAHGLAQLSSDLGKT